jgi:hypothetical protein
MQRTVYSALNSEELVDFAVQRDNATQMEIELAQRLMVAMAMLEEANGADARGESQERRKAAAN